jgi:hypothetical protein
MQGIKKPLKKKFVNEKVRRKMKISIIANSCKDIALEQCLG